MSKRWFKSPLMAAMGGIALFASAAAAADSQENAALVFNFDQTQNATLSDTSGQGHTGQLVNFKDADLVPGVFGNALRFNGVSSHVVIENAGKLAFPGKDFTLSLWVKPEKADGTILSKLSDRTSSAGRYQIELIKGVPHVRYRAAQTKYARVAGNEKLALGQWHHLAVVFDVANKQISLYVNGKLDKQEAWEGQTSGAEGQPLYLGAHAAGQVQPSFGGSLDDVKIIAKALKPEQVAAEWGRRQRAIQAGSPWANSDVMAYVVPPVTSTRWMANIVPSAEQVSDTIPMVAAKGEFESASFIVYSFAYIEKLEIAVSDLKGQQKSQTIPADNLSLRVVKRWYQSGNAWDGYPLQNRARRVLVPELLLRDEKLIRVDHETQDNYLRLDRESGPEYVSISYPEFGGYGKPFSIPHLGRSEFNFATEPVGDADTLQPVAFTMGQAKQFWLTLKVPTDATADTYAGTITLTADGKKLGVMTVQLRVLPYELPLPRTYYDLSRDYYIKPKNPSRLIVELKLAQSREHAIKRVRAMAENLVAHGAIDSLNAYLYPNFTEQDAETFALELSIHHEAGMTRRFVNAGDAGPIRWWVKPKDEAEAEKRVKDFEHKIDTALRIIKEVTGLDADKVWFYGIDEAHGEKLTMQLPSWTYISQKGANILAVGWDENIRTMGFAQDMHSKAGKPSRDAADQWHAVGGRITTYAYPFSGPEDPALWRRNVGFLPYKAHYDGFMLYTVFEGNTRNVWNDFLPQQYRGLNMVYPTRDGVIDTLAWEGFREGVDDVRYATLMKMLAAEAFASADVNVRHAGKRALQYLALLDSETADLDTARLEIISHIDTLRQALGKGE